MKIQFDFEQGYIDVWNETDEQIEDVMKFKIDRQLERIKEEK